MTTKTLNRSEILQKVEDTSSFLGTILGTSSFKLVMIDAEHGDNKVVSDYKGQWGTNTSEDSSNWLHYFGEMGQKPSKFILAAYHGKTLSGLCLFDTNNKHVQSDSITIQTIEGKETNNPLRGLTVPIFCQAALGIATITNSQNLCVINPVGSTLHSYRRSLPQIEEKTHIRTRIDADTKISWSTVFDYQKQKGRFTPTGF